jgi:hypothetical protein
MDVAPQAGRRQLHCNRQFRGAEELRMPASCRRPFESVGGVGTRLPKAKSCERSCKTLNWSKSMRGNTVQSGVFGSRQAHAASSAAKLFRKPSKPLNRPWIRNIVYTSSRPSSPAPVCHLRPSNTMSPKGRPAERMPVGMSRRSRRTDPCSKSSSASSDRKQAWKVPVWHFRLPRQYRGLKTVHPLSGTSSRSCAPPTPTRSPCT